MPDLNLVSACFLGSLGGVVVTLTDIVRLSHGSRGELLEYFRQPSTWVGEFARALLGGIFAGVLFWGEQISGPFGVLAVGAAAPMIGDRLKSGVGVLDGTSMNTLDDDSYNNDRERSE